MKCCVPVCVGWKEMHVHMFLGLVTAPDLHFLFSGIMLCRMRLRLVFYILNAKINHTVNELSYWILLR